VARSGLEPRIAALNVEIAKVNATVVEGRRRASARWTSNRSWRVGGRPAPPIPRSIPVSRSPRSDEARTSDATSREAVGRPLLHALTAKLCTPEYRLHSTTRDLVRQSIARPVPLPAGRVLLGIATADTGFIHPKPERMRPRPSRVQLPPRQPGRAAMSGHRPSAVRCARRRQGDDTVRQGS